MQLSANSKLVVRDAVGAAATQFTTDANTVNMKGYNRCRAVLILTQSGAGTGTVTLKQSTVAAGTDEKALAFAEYWKNETGTTTDALTLVTASTLTTAGAATATNMYVFEIRADQLDIDNAFTFVRLDLVSLSNNTAACLFYELYEPRVAKGPDAMPTAIT